MEVISRISSPLSESWVAWIMLLLLFFSLINRLFLPEINVAFRSVSSHGDRAYTPSNSPLQYITWIYKVAVISMAIYLLLLDTGAVFSFANFCIVLGVMTGIYWLQFGCVKLLGAVFFTHRQATSASEQRTLVQSAVCGIMLPILMLLLWNVNAVTMGLVLLLAVVYLGVLLMRIIQLYYNNLLTIIYILLYIISLEVIPLLGAILWLKTIL